MPRLIHRTPKYCHHKATGQAVVTLNGRDYYLGKYRSAGSKKQYARLISQWLESGGVTPDATAADGLSLNELLAAFWRHAQEYYRDQDGQPSQEQINFGTLIRRLRRAYGSTPASEFGPLKLKAFRQLLIGDELSRTNINRQITRLRSIFKWAVGNELLPDSALNALKCVDGLRYGKSAAKESEPVKPVSEHLVDAVLPQVPPQIRTMIQLQRLTGMRSGEVAQMRTCDINTQGSVWTYTPARHKTMHRGHQRAIYLGPAAQEVLKPWLRRDLQAYLFSPAEAAQWRRVLRHEQRKTPIGYGNRPGSNRRRKPKRNAGDRYTAGSYGRAILYACEVAFQMPAELRQIPKNQPEDSADQRQHLHDRRKSAAQWRREHCWHPHQLRHNAATRFRREYGLEVARLLLGHKHTDVTQIYAEADQTRAIEVMAKIG